MNGRELSNRHGLKKNLRNSKNLIIPIYLVMDYTTCLNVCITLIQ